MRYKARPAEVEAIEWRGDLNDLPQEWRDAEFFDVDDDTGRLIVPTIQGPSTAEIGWFVAHSPAGPGLPEEFYPIESTRFHQRWEAIG